MTLTQILQKIRNAFYTKKEIDSMGGGASLSDTISQKADKSDLSNYLPKSGGTITGSIDKVGTVCMWKDGRRWATIKTTAPSNPANGQYIPCISAKSYQGSWEFGPYVNNNFYLTYMTDDNVNANVNTPSAQYMFGSDGALVANKFIANGIDCSVDSQGDGWIRYSSGLQICWGEFTNNTTYGWGKPFNSNPVAIASHHTGSNIAVNATITVLNAAGVGVKLSYMGGGDVTSAVLVIAIGRWK